MFSTPLRYRIAALPTVAMTDLVRRHVAGVFLFLTIFIGATAFTGFGNNADFNSEKWLHSNARERGRMAEDLVASGVLVGHPVREVQELLGRPDKDWGKVLQYQIDLGWPMKKPTTYGLQVHLDEDRNVRFVKIVD